MKYKKKYKKFKGKTIYVKDDNVQRAIKKFKRMVSNNNILSQYNQNRYFIKPSVKRRKKQSLKKFKIKIFMINSQED